MAFFFCMQAGREHVVLADRVLPPHDLESINVHFVVEHAHQDVVNHGSPYNHDAQGMWWCGASWGKCRFCCCC